jgi:hypothetical protein
MKACQALSGRHRCPFDEGGLLRLHLLGRLQPAAGHPLGLGAGTFRFPATHRYRKKSFRQHRHKSYTVVAFAPPAARPSQGLRPGGGRREENMPLIATVVP